MPIQITIEQIKELRDSTGISVMQCKHALEEAQGDMKKALAILKKTSSDIALKKSNREIKDGKIRIKTKGKRAVLVSLYCETDFVAKNEDFINLLEQLVDKAIDGGMEKMQKEAKAMIDPIIQKTGENIALGNICEMEGEILGSYVHNNKSGVIVSLEGGNTELAKDIAMHITAMKPDYTRADEILDQPFIKDMNETVGKLLEKNKTKIKEVKLYFI